MDIGVPYRVLGPVEVAPARELVSTLPPEAWEANRLRQELLSGKSHRMATRAILLKYNWVPYQQPWHVRSLRQLVLEWCRQENVDPEPLLPEVEAENDKGEVNVFPQWNAYKAVIGPLVDQAISYLDAPNGVVTRIALVELFAGQKILPHIDGQDHAIHAHRVHIPLISPPGVVYKIDGKKFKMSPGYAYDFNNRRRHGVQNNSRRPRVNILMDFLPNPGPRVERFFPPPLPTPDPPPRQGR